MSHVTPQTARKLLSAGYRQPEPKVGQVWAHKSVTGCDFEAVLVKVSPNEGLPLCTFVSFESAATFQAYTDESYLGIVFCPTATDILATIQLQVGEHCNVEFYCPTVAHRNFDALASIDRGAFSGRSENPAEAAAQLWLQLNKK